MDKRLHMLIDWVGETASKANGLVVPVSGGSDSALTFFILNQAYPTKTLGVYAGENLRARQWFEKTGKVSFMPLDAGGRNPEVARMAMFLSLALKEQRWLVGTRNRSEDTLGTFSLASRVAVYLPIVGLWKAEVLELAAQVGVPDEVLASSRRADPECGRPAELAEIPIESIDLFLKVKEGLLSQDELSALTTEQTTYLEQVYTSNQFRRGLPTRGPSQ